MTAAARVVLMVAAALALPAAVRAQTAADDRPVRRLEVSFGGGLLAGAALGEADANLRTRTGGDFRLFAVESEFGTSGLVEVRAGVALTRRYGVEARLGFSRPELRALISSDFEGAPAITVAERIDQYMIDGALIVMLDALRIGPVIPFASGGAGYLRQLHEDNVGVEAGTVYHAGGGVKHWLFTRQQGFVNAAGLRGDVRLYIVTGGIETDDRTPLHGAVSGSFFVVF